MKTCWEVNQILRPVSCKSSPVVQDVVFRSPLNLTTSLMHENIATVLFRSHQNTRYEDLLEDRQIFSLRYDPS